MNRILWVEGIIGAGKTTLVEQLAAALGLTPFYEPVETNPYLDLFYTDPKLWAFRMQVHMLSRRFAIHQAAPYASTITGQGGAILDRGLPGDRVFASLQRRYGNIDALDWETYEHLFQTMSRSVVAPGVILFLDVPPAVAQHRIEQRGREAEDNLPLSYLSDLRSEYLQLLDDLGRGSHPWAQGIQVLRWAWGAAHQPVEPLVETLRPMLAAA